MECKRCEKVVKKGRGYPMINKEIYCRKCYDILKWNDKIKREKEKRCQKN